MKRITRTAVVAATMLTCGQVAPSFGQVVDLLDLLAAWGPCAPPCPADSNQDGVVDHQDLMVLLLLPDEGVPEGYMIIEGDIIVPEDFFEQGVSAATYATNLWPGGIVPFEFDANVSPAHQAQALAAMAEWEAVANVDFQQCPGNNCCPLCFVACLFPCSFVHIQDAGSNSSFVGMQGVPQPINIVSWNNTFIIVHELGHALGYWHEQSRADRDQYVQINWANIQQGTENNFQIRPDQGPLGSGEYGPYDFDSVMHYPACAFSICCPPGTTCQCPTGCATITVLPPNQQWQGLIGQRNHLSQFDGVTMSFLYPEANWRFVDQAQAGAQNGTFLEPYAQFNVGVGNTPSGGTLWVQPATYSAVGTYTNAITIRAPLGGVTLAD
jgi:hypothetical protein